MTAGNDARAALVVTILASERTRLPDGRDFTGLNCETDAARALLADGYTPEDRMAFVWHDGRASSSGPIGAYARWRYSEDGRQRWKPHPRANIPHALVLWAARLASEPRAARVVAKTAAPACAGFLGRSGA